MVKIFSNTGILTKSPSSVLSPYLTSKNLEDYNQLSVHYLLSLGFEYLIDSDSKLNKNLYNALLSFLYVQVYNPL